MNLASFAQSGQQPILLKWHQLAQAPKTCGLYAWYYAPRISPKNAESREDSVGRLATIASNLRFPDVALGLSGHLSLKFRGELRHEHLGKEALDALTTVDRIMASSSGRQQLAQMLGRSVPMLAAPLYIGVSTNLRWRLMQPDPTPILVEALADLVHQLQDLLFQDPRWTIDERRGLLSQIVWTVDRIQKLNR